MDGAAGLTTDTDTAATDTKEVPQEPHGDVAPKAAPPKPDPLFFPMLLRTQRLMERDARSARLSSLRIV